MVHCCNLWSTGYLFLLQRLILADVGKRVPVSPFHFCSNRRMNIHLRNIQMGYIRLFQFYLKLRFTTGTLFSDPGSPLRIHFHGKNKLIVFIRCFFGYILVDTKGRVADPHQFNAVPDPAFHFSDQDPTFHRFRIRILILIRVMRICDHWSTDPPGLHFGL